VVRQLAHVANVIVNKRAVHYRRRQCAVHHDRARDCCQMRLLATVMPKRLADSCVTTGPPGKDKILRPVRSLKRFSEHHSKKVKT
jgi:hypothetical protein